jgi:hypothetical protein
MPHSTLESAPAELLIQNPAQKILGAPPHNNSPLKRGATPGTVGTGRGRKEIPCRRQQISRHPARHSIRAALRIAPRSHAHNRSAMAELGTAPV